jgi:peroxiredoxin
MLNSLLIIIFIFMLMPFTIASDNISSYQKNYQQLMEKNKVTKSPFTEQDRKIMQQSSHFLARELPNPGIQVGKKVPDFTLINPFGKKVNLYNELKDGPVILVFYRGAWCPFCNLHLHVLQESLDKFQELGAKLITITPQKPDKSVTQFKAKGYSFEVLSDLDSNVMKSFNLYLQLPENLIAVYKSRGLDIESFNGIGRNVLPVPGTFVIDPSGIVQAMQADIDYKLRMEPSAIIEALKKMINNL